MNAFTSLSPRGPREILSEYFCRGQKHWSTSYYTDFRCQSWTWNEDPNMGNDVRGREKTFSPTPPEKNFVL